MHANTQAQTTGPFFFSTEETTMQNQASQKRGPRNGSRPSRFQRGWRINWVDCDHKRHFQCFQKYEEAAAQLERIKGELRAMKDGRIPMPTKSPTFADFVERRYVPARSSQKRNPRDDASIFRAHLLPEFGALPLASITTARVEQYRARLLQSGLATGSIINVLRLLGSTLRYAFDIEMLARLPKIKKPRPVVTQFAHLKTENEVRAFLSAAKEEGPLVFACYATAIASGLRAGELFGLRWSDIDFDKRLITVARSYDKPTKTGKIRYVPIFDLLLPILREWRLQNPSELVFCTSIGTMYTPTARIQSQTLKGVLKRAELPRLRFHDLRHSFASQWVLHGGDIFKLQRILGHSSMAMTQRYAHLAPDAFTQDYGIFGAMAPTETAEVATLEPSEGTANG
jgi:integrase